MLWAAGGSTHAPGSAGTAVSGFWSPGPRGNFPPGKKNCRNLHFYPNAGKLKPTQLPGTSLTSVYSRPPDDPPTLCSSCSCCDFQVFPFSSFPLLSKLKDNHFWCMISLTTSHDILLLGSTNKAWKKFNFICSLCLADGSGHDMGI